MEDRVRMLVAELFRDAPRSGKTLELRDEMEQNLLDRYGDLVADGKTPDEAFEEIRSSVGDMSELFGEVERSSVYERRAYGNMVTTDEPSSFPPPGGGTERDARGAAYGTERNGGIFAPGYGDRERTARDFGTNYGDAGRSARDGGTDAGTYGAAAGAVGIAECAEEASARESQRKRRRIAGSLIGSMWCLLTALYFIVSFATQAWHLTWLIFLAGASLTCLITFAANNGPGRQRRFGALYGALWPAIAAVYFILSFTTGAWHVTWLIFPAGACLSSVIRLIASRGNARATWNAINSAFWSLVVVLYLAVSFGTGAWYVTWVIFLIASALVNAMRIFRKEAAE